jgi:aspartate kinase
LIVMKFGGSCLDKSRDIRRMVEILKTAEQLQPKVVLSAFKGTTDQLLSQANLAKEGSFDLGAIETKHREFLADLPSPLRAKVQPHIEELLKELRDSLTGVRYVHELTPTVLDRILAYGEKLAIHIASGYLAEEKLHGVPVSDSEAGILTDSNFGNASILEQSYQLVRERLSSVQMPLVAGFFGKDSEGRIATLGRGATDYVASFIAAAFGCRTILFKDVDGVMTADPKIVPTAKLISNIDYSTAIELGRFGSKVVFEKAVIPAMKANTPIEVKRFDKENQGTLISGTGSAGATTYMRGMAMVNISGIRALSQIGSILTELNATFADDPIVLASVFHNGFSLVTNERRVDKVCEVASSVAGANTQVDVRKALSVVALVGERFQISQVHEKLQEAHIDPLAVVKTSAGRTTCAVVERDDTDASLRSLHDGLLLNQRLD